MSTGIQTSDGVEEPETWNQSVQSDPKGLLQQNSVGSSPPPKVHVQGDIGPTTVNKSRAVENRMLAPLWLPDANKNKSSKPENQARYSIAARNVREQSKNYQARQKLSNDLTGTTPAYSSNDLLKTIQLLAMLVMRFYSLHIAKTDLEALNLAIACQYHVILLSIKEGVTMVIRLQLLGTMLLDRVQIQGLLPDLNWAIECLSGAFGLGREGVLDPMDTLRSLGEAHIKRFERTGATNDLESAIGYQNEVIITAGNKHKHYAIFLAELGSLYGLRYKVWCRPEDAHTAIECQTQALVLYPEGHEDWTLILNKLGNSYLGRFWGTGWMEDLSRAIEYHIQAVRLTPEGHPQMFCRLDNLANSYSSRFEHLGEIDDIENAIACHIRAIPLIPNGHKSLPLSWSTLGSSYSSRFRRLGEIEDIDRAIECITTAVQLTPGQHPNMPDYLSNLGTSHKCRFERLGTMEDINKAIELLGQAISLVPQGDVKMATLCLNLGNSYSDRFDRSGILEDIDRAIEYQTQTVKVTPEGHPNMPGRFNCLGGSYLSRFKRLGEIEDLNKAIEFSTWAVQITPGGHPDMPVQFSGLGTSYLCRFEQLGQIEDVDRAINCQTQAVQLTPEGHAVMPDRLNNLGNSFMKRFNRLGQMEDLNTAIERYMWAIRLSPERHANIPWWLGNFGNACIARFQHLGEIEDVDRAIGCQTQAVQLAPEGDAGTPNLLKNLGNSHRCRFGRLGKFEDANRAVECHTKAVTLTPERHPNMPTYLDNLGGSYECQFKCRGDPDDLTKAVEFHRRAVAITPYGHAGKPGRLYNLGNILRLRFHHSKEPEHIEEAIETLTQALHNFPKGDKHIPDAIQTLVECYKARVLCSRNRHDLFLAIACLMLAGSSSTGLSTTRFNASRSWAKLSSMFEASFSLPAYKSVMQLLPEVVWLGTTVGRRYQSIDEVGAVAVEAAGAAISASEYELAIEWLEEGRSIVWNQMLQLRAPFDDLAAADPMLAQNLQEVASKLESASRRSPNTAPLGSNTVALEQAAVHHHRLVDQYNQLISNVRDLPNFEHFMRPKKAAELIPAAQSGAVIVVNVHANRCDALVLRPNIDGIGHIPLPDLSYDVVARLQELMQQSLEDKELRERKLTRPYEYQCDHFEHILATLWHRLVKPVLDFLGYMKMISVEQLPHITWCTTGALSFLPIHAAGCYDEGGDHIFDFAITSYTPTLSSLLPSKSPRSAGQGGVLAVSQESTPGLSNLPGTEHELAHIKKRVGNIPYMQLKNSEATPTTVLEAMGNYECVHLACHASQDVENPTESCFHLHGGTLSLAEIAQMSLKNKGLAFLSACQTATGDAKMPDEAIHLAAGMLVAGYPSVIATMWSISDHDAPLVADQVYGQIVQDGKLEVTSAARALHAAVGVLRAKVGETAFSRWVPYIHIGV